MNTQTLEGMVKPKARFRRVNALRKVIDYFLPFMDKYDALGEAESLLKDPDVSKTGIEVQTVARYLDSANRNMYRGLMRTAKFADTADRLTSTVGAVAEAVGLGFGIAPGFLANGGEEAIEMFAKAPALIQLYMSKYGRDLIPKILAVEAATFAAPVLGDVADIATNLYVGAAYRVIREDTKDRILEEHRKRRLADLAR